MDFNPIRDICVSQFFAMKNKYLLLLMFVFIAVAVSAQSKRKKSIAAIAPATTPAAGLPRPKLVVGIVVDQMRWDYL